MVKVECVARGYLTGGALQEYRATGAVCGVELPPGLRRGRPPAGADLHADHEGPARRARRVHDVRRRGGAGGRGRRRARCARSRSRSTAAGAEMAAENGASSSPTPRSSSVATGDGTLVLADEVLTPDSSRFWPADQWAARAAPVLVRQAVRARLGRRHRVGQARRRVRRFPPTWSSGPGSATSTCTSGSPDAPGVTRAGWHRVRGDDPRARRARGAHLGRGARPGARAPTRCSSTSWRARSTGPTCCSGPASTRRRRALRRTWAWSAPAGSPQSVGT